jgi:hypothetical protein
LGDPTPPSVFHTAAEPQSQIAHRLLILRLQGTDLGFAIYMKETQKRPRQAHLDQDLPLLF